MNSPVDVTTKQRGAITVAHIAGEPDLANVREVERQLWDGIPNTSTGAVVDLSGVRYLDSAGLNLLFNLQRGLGKRGQRLCLIVPERALIRAILHVVQLDAAIEILSTIEEALRSFGVPAV